MKLIILDRDGVINQDSPDFIKSADEWHPIPGSLEAIALLNNLGITVVVATNQSGIARDLYSLDTLNQIHEKMKASLKDLGGKIEDIFYCPHGPDDHCLCRKPLPGLYFQIAEKYGISLENVPAVGDSYRDIEAAIAANAKPILVLTGNGQKTLKQHADKLQHVPQYPDLLAFVKTLSHQAGEGL